VSAFFVTATGTAIGKTYVIENLISRWLQDAREVRALKPVISGFDPDHPDGSDTARLLKATGKALSLVELDAMSPWRYAAPLSPDMAAALENKRIPFNDIVAFCKGAIAQAERRSAPLLIEGIGGVMVPLDENRTVLDLIAALSIPAILVCGSYLGSLSHTLTAVTALRQRGISIDRIIINETPGSTVTLTEVRTALARFTQQVPVETLPFRPLPSSSD
jgi:dethiobiotin synthetase